MKIEVMPMEFMMDKDLNELEIILGAEQKLFGKYLEMLTEQQQYLIENDLTGLKSTIEKINLLAQEALNLENGRRNIVRRISRKLKITGEDITLARLLEKLECGNFKKLEELKNMILDIHVKAAAQKERNELLINQSMNIIRRTVNYMNERKNPRVTYKNPSANSGADNRRGAMLTRTA